MSDTSTTEQLSADSSETAGHGRHRGPVAAQESETTPHGRHRKPVQETAEAAA
ncbi:MULTISPECIES: hypothetical protein [Streptomyces]|uniref:Uncharacterized protein n=2 Tax=Streptomyces TaxID=1883 RepID=A0ABS9JP07_9ACTN|nr:MULTISPECIES: hypothetical protein [Streptomyces]MCG0067231.1 hypothetical protein [Streptomyces tricolor]OYP17891.1 hypothetical protein CFC35_28170 [Streptomyces sp. FBKL.4005]BCM66577.1 hypothetical protein EASAB2608_01911 [Streptomyces sp. EAS-AB2608]CUW28161.1 hypothetical protein TUE45_02891 [Streptomyces reticuli]